MKWNPLPILRGLSQLARQSLVERLAASAVACTILTVIFILAWGFLVAWYAMKRFLLPIVMALALALAGCASAPCRCQAPMPAAFPMPPAPFPLHLRPWSTVAPMLEADEAADEAAHPERAVKAADAAAEEAAHPERTAREAKAVWQLNDLQNRNERLVSP
jgi:hypothetical protein